MSQADPLLHHAHDISEWAALSNQAFVPLKYHAHQRSFHGQLRNISSPISSVVWVESDALTVERTGKEAASYVGPELLLMVQLGGSSAVTQSERSAELQPGAAVLYDPQSPYTLEFPDDGHQLIVAKIDRRRLGLPAEHLKTVTAVTLDSSLPGHASLLGLLSGAARDSIALSATASALLVELVRPMLESLESAYSPAAEDAKLVDDILHTARERIGDPELDAAQLAQLHFVSERKLYYLFNARGESPADWIRNARIDRAKQLLASGHLSITAVAAEVGYKDATSFSRAFKRQVGMPPAAFRAQQLSS